MNIHIDITITLLDKRQRPAESEQAPTLDDRWEAMPAYLRTGRVEAAWHALQEKGILDSHYQMTAQVRSKALARDLAEHLCLIHDPHALTEWHHFEKLWDIKNLRIAQKSYSKKLKAKISAIFSTF